MFLPTWVASFTFPGRSTAKQYACTVCRARYFDLDTEPTAQYEYRMHGDTIHRQAHPRSKITNPSYPCILYFFCMHIIIGLSENRLSYHHRHHPWINRSVIFQTRVRIVTLTIPTVLTE